MKKNEIISAYETDKGFSFPVTNDRHLKIGRSLTAAYCGELNTAATSEISFMQQTKSLLGSESRLNDDFDFRQQFQSWEQPEAL